MFVNGVVEKGVILAIGVGCDIGNANNSIVGINWVDVTEFEGVVAG